MATQYDPIHIAGTALYVAAGQSGIAHGPEAHQPRMKMGADRCQAKQDWIPACAGIVHGPEAHQPIMKMGADWCQAKQTWIPACGGNDGVRDSFSEELPMGLRPTNRG